MTSNGLKRQLGFWDSVAINIGIVIGVGIFRVPAEVTKYLGSSLLVLLAWALGGLVSLLGVLCYAELSSCLPETGGSYAFLRASYGKLVSFLYGWIEFSILRGGSLAGVAYVFTAYLNHFISIGAGNEKLVTILAIVTFTAINIAGLRFGTGIQNVLSTLKVVALLAMSGLIFRLVPGPVFKQTPLLLDIGWDKARWIAPAMIPILWTYGGWHESTFMSGEFRETNKELPLSLITGILMITGLYLLVNTAYLKVMEPVEMARSKAIASDVFLRLFGPSGQTVVTAAVLISACGALNSTVLTGGRIPYAVGCDYPRCLWFGKVHPRLGTPLRAFILNGLWASILALWGNFEQLLFFCGFAKWLVFALAGFSVFILRRHDRFLQVRQMPQAPGPGRQFAMSGYPWVPTLFVAISFFLCWTTIHYAPRQALFGFLLIVTGLPVYFLAGGRLADAFRSTLRPVRSSS
ncbi:MAG: amino acid permease [Candidatus Omnitrophica bacterium]|nr:amino acid permease [Candidatus Omnitrophota bacterium]